MRRVQCPVIKANIEGHGDNPHRPPISFTTRHPRIFQAKLRHVADNEGCHSDRQSLFSLSHTNLQGLDGAEQRELRTEEEGDNTDQ